MKYHLAENVYFSSFLGTILLLLLCAILFLIVHAWFLKIYKTIWIPSAAVLFSGVILFYYINCLINPDAVNLKPFRAVQGIPFPVVCVLFLIMAAGNIWIFIRIRSEQKKKIGFDAIKEFLDNLPDGICFSAEDGIPLLINRRMNEISAELTGMGVLSADDFWKKISSRNLKDPSHVLIRTNDGKIWNLQRKIRSIGQETVKETVAFDVTTLYDLSEKLEQRNKNLSEINQRLNVYSRQIGQMVRTKEILSAKAVIHNNVGRCLLSFRAYQAGPAGPAEREKLIKLWKDTFSLLHRTQDTRQQTDRWELLQQAAESIQVKIELDGELPRVEPQRDLLINAIHECLTNTVKHAEGNILFVKIIQDESRIIITIRNNGNPPSGPVLETGGLLNLRGTIERAGGEMEIQSSPVFQLKVAFDRNIGGDHE